MRLITPRSSARRNRRGRGLPSCGLGRDAADLDQAEAQPEQRVRHLGILVEAGGEADRIARASGPRPGPRARADRAFGRAERGRSSGRGWQGRAPPRHRGATAGDRRRGTSPCRLVSRSPLWSASRLSACRAPDCGRRPMASLNSTGNSSRKSSRMRGSSGPVASVQARGLATGRGRCGNRRHSTLDAAGRAGLEARLGAGAHRRAPRSLAAIEHQDQTVVRTRPLGRHVVGEGQAGLRLVGLHLGQQRRRQPVRPACRGRVCQPARRGRACRRRH